MPSGKNAGSLPDFFIDILSKRSRVHHYKYHQNPFYTDDHFGSEMN